MDGWMDIAIGNFIRCLLARGIPSIELALNRNRLRATRGRAWSLSIILVSKRGEVERKAREEDLIDFRGACRFRDPGKTGSSRAISSERMLRVGTNRARTL